MADHVTNQLNLPFHFCIKEYKQIFLAMPAVYLLYFVVKSLCPYTVYASGNLHRLQR